MDEKTKQENFRRVLEPRMSKLIKQFALVRACLKGTNYSYSENDYNKIYNAIVKELEAVESVYKSKSNKDVEEFSL